MNIAKTIVALLNWLPLPATLKVAHDEQWQVYLQSNHRFSSQAIL